MERRKVAYFHRYDKKISHKTSDYCSTVAVDESLQAPMNQMCNESKYSTLI